MLNIVVCFPSLAPFGLPLTVNLVASAMEVSLIVMICHVMRMLYAKRQVECGNAHVGKDSEGMDISV